MGLCSWFVLIDSLDPEESQAGKMRVALMEYSTLRYFTDKSGLPHIFEILKFLVQAAPRSG
jgi:hypothetical protein